MDGLIYRSTSKRRKTYTIHHGTVALDKLIVSLPDTSDSIRMLSNGGFSAINIILFVASKTNIRSMYVSTLRVGKKHAQALDRLHKRGKLQSASFVVGSVMRHNTANGKDYQYADYFDKVRAANGWIVDYKSNHSKVILMDTDSGFYVVETSSNLNENPKVEQFCFERDEGLYMFYKQALFDAGCGSNDP